MNLTAVGLIKTFPGSRCTHECDSRPRQLELKYAGVSEGGNHCGELASRLQSS